MRLGSADESRSFVWSALGVVLAGSLAAACGTTTNHDAQDRSILAEAAAATQAAGTAEIDTTYTISGLSSMTERTVYDFRSQIGEVIPSLPPGRPPEEILDGTTTYRRISSDPAAGIGIPGKTWLADQLPHLEGPGIEAISPATIVAGLIPVVQATRKIGNQTIDGAETTRYDLKLSAGAMKEILVFNPAFEVSFQPASIWIDNEQRLRRIQISYTTPDDGQTTSTSNYLGFGVAVNVTIPAANQIETLEQYEKYICIVMKSQPNSPGVGISVAEGPNSGPATC